MIKATNKSNYQIKQICQSTIKANNKNRLIKQIQLRKMKKYNTLNVN